MPALPDARHEAFAQAVAQGARAEQAYEDAGFAPGNGHGARLRERKEVAERIAELRAAQTHLAEASTEAVIAALLQFTKVGETARSPAAIREARLALLDIHRLRQTLDMDRACERREIATAKKFRNIEGLRD